MLENSVHVNLLLTGILAQLAAYPQPLLRSFLLNTNMVFQPSVRSLYQVAPAAHAEKSITARIAMGNFTRDRQMSQFKNAVLNRLTEGRYVEVCGDLQDGVRLKLFFFSHRRFKPYI